MVRLFAVKYFRSTAQKGRRNMKKKILLCVLAATMVASVFTGCGKTTTTRKTTSFKTDELKESFKTNQKIDTSKDIELTVWESTNGPDEFIEKAGDYFTKLYPNIKIKYVNVESTNADSQIALDGPAGHGPDLFATAHNNIGKLANNENIYAVPEEEADIVKSSCSASALSGATLTTSDGKSTIYGYPVSTETYALFYNKDIVKEDEVPKTMGDLVNYINNFKGSSDQTAFLFDAGNAYYSVMFTSTKDNHLYGPNGNDMKDSNMVTDAAIAQMEDFTNLSKAIKMNSADIAYSSNDELFKAGLLGMEISGAWNIRGFEEAGINFGITSIPALTATGEPPVNFMGVRCMFVSDYSKHKPEAVAFAEFLMTKEMQQLRCELTTTMPARDDVLDNIKDEKIKNYLSGINEQIKYSYPMPNIAQASLFWTAFGTAYANIWNGDAADVKTALSEADSAATKK